MIKLDISPNKFRNEFQSKKPFLVRNSFVPQITDRQIDEIVLRADIIQDDFKLNFEGKVLPKNKYVESFQDVGKVRNRFIKAALVDYMRRGATLIANKLYNEPLIYNYHKQIEEIANRPALSSLYISYGNEDDSSFRAHWDTRDVFVLQLVGRKKWILHEPNFEYPLPSQQSKDMEHVVKCPTTEPYMEVILEEGDLLYVPRGWWHDPVPCGERTVHLSVGTYAIYRNDYLHWIIQNILPGYPEARMHLDSYNSIDDLTAYANLIHEKLTDPELLRNFHRLHAVEHYRTNDTLNLNSLCDPNIEEIPEEKSLYINLFHCVEDLEKDIIANGTFLKIESRPDMRKVLQCILDHQGISTYTLLKKMPNLDKKYVKNMLFKLACFDIIRFD